MKFLCPSCKAKYQIADEKVIGRTVKMKCRHCGHLIEINEVAVGASTSSVLPPPPATATESAPQSDPQASSAMGAAAKVKPPPKPARSPTPAAGTPLAPDSRQTEPKPTNPALQRGRPAPSAVEKPRISAVPLPRPAPVPARPAKPTVESAHHAESAESPPRHAVPVAKSARSAELGPSRLQQSRTPTAAVSASIGRLPGVPETVASSLGAASNQHLSPRTDGLAGAFSKAVAAPVAQTESADHPLAGDEWYVGVNDQPIGPIRLTEIRDRAAQGEITSDCLVWRDGFEDWKPLTAFPELVAVVEEGVASYRSLRPPPPGVVQPPAGSYPTASAPSSAVVEPPPAAASAATLAGAAAAVHLDDEALHVAAGLTRPKIPPAAWLAVGMALVLGVTFGMVIIKPEPPKQVIKYVEVPVAAKQTGAAEGQPQSQAASDPGNAPAAANENRIDSASANEKRNGTSAKKVTGGPSAESPTTAASTDVAQGLKGLQSLQGLGPRTGPASDVGASASGRQQLDSATLSRTVSRYTASVKRSCWQPALDTRAPDASTSARISANIVVSPSGKVQSVNVSPDPKGYRGLSSCIQARVRAWEFPPAGGTTEFNVPFVFAAQ